MAALPVGITADDLTGAADTAAALARPGAAVMVSLGPRPQIREGRTAFAVTTNSRACDPEQVYGLVRASVGALQAAGAGLIYKKVDSNLRGSIGAELAAVRDATGGPVFFAPAFPARGRTTVKGVALVHGTPVTDTEMARDPEAPATHSQVLELVRDQRPDLPIALCPLSVVRAGAEAMHSLLPGAGMLAVDAESDADLDQIAKAALSLAPLPALAGSAGLAAAVARLLLGPARPRTWSEQRAGPVLAILASSSEALVAQVKVAAARGDLSPIPLPCQELTREDRPVPQLRQAMAAAIGELDEGRDAIVYASGPLPPGERPVELVVEHLAHLALVVVKAARPRGLVVGGGATAVAALEALGAEGIDVDDEPLPGIAAGPVLGGILAGRPVVLKPGAAGDEGALVRLLDYLRGRAGELERA
jgi:uncharacterized protein YgbK (DUF1537 family)